MLGTPPKPPSLHNPTPEPKQPPADNSPAAQQQPAARYTPYVGTLQAKIDELLEENRTVPRNWAFLIFTDADVVRYDPRPTENRMTELELVWGGASARYNPLIAGLPSAGEIIFPGIDFHERPCIDYIHYTRLTTNYKNCGNPQFKHCCTVIDDDRLDADAFKCGIGVVEETFGRNFLVHSEMREKTSFQRNFDRNFDFPDRLKSVFGA